MSEKTYRFLSDLPSDGLRTALPTRRSVHIVKALRSPMKHRIARGTTKSFWQKDVVVSQESCKSVNSWPFFVQAHAEQRRDGVTAAF